MGEVCKIVINLTNKCNRFVFVDLYRMQCIICSDLFMASTIQQFGRVLDETPKTNDQCDDSGVRRSLSAVRPPGSIFPEPTGYHYVAERANAVRANLNGALSGGVCGDEESPTSKRFSAQAAEMRVKPKMQKIRGQLLGDSSFFPEETYTSKAVIAEELAKLICIKLVGTGDYEDFAPVVEAFMKNIDRKSFSNWLNGKRAIHNVGPTRNTTPWRVMDPVDDNKLEWWVFNPASRESMKLYLFEIIKGLDL